MLLEILANHFDTCGIKLAVRPVIARELVRYMIGATPTIPKASKVFRPKLPQVQATETLTLFRRLSWDRDIMTQYWRAFAAYLDQKNLSYAHDVGIQDADVYHMYAVLTSDDIQDFVALNRNWQHSIISDKDVCEIMHRLERTIAERVRVMRGLWSLDGGTTADDWHSYMSAEALHLIYRYESEYTLSHMLNSCRTMIVNQSINMLKRYHSSKHALTIYDPIAKCDTPARLGLFCQGADGDELDTLAAHGYVHPACLDDVSTSVFIDNVAHERPRVARYLRLLVYAQDEAGTYGDVQCAPALSDNQTAAAYCGLTAEDLRWLRARAMSEHLVTHA